MEFGSLLIGDNFFFAQAHPFRAFAERMGCRSLFRPAISGRSRGKGCPHYQQMQNCWPVGKHPRGQKIPEFSSANTAVGRAQITMAVAIQKLIFMSRTAVLFLDIASILSVFSLLVFSSCFLFLGSRDWKHLSSSIGPKIQ
jgi:hypothetical protein